MDLTRNDRHDKMAGYMGNNECRFIDIYANQVDDIQRKMIEYAKLLQRAMATHPVNDSTNPNRRADMEIQTQAGYPVTPPVIDGVEQRKEELEDLLRRYLNAHYSERFSSVHLD